MRIYVGNLSFNATEDDVQKAFAPYGTISAVSIIKDQMTGKSRGFAFVEMPDMAEAQKAINSLNGQSLMGRPITVNEAHARGGPAQASD